MFHIVERTASMSKVVVLTSTTFADAEHALDADFPGYGDAFMSDGRLLMIEPAPIPAPTVWNGATARQRVGGTMGS